MIPLQQLGNNESMSSVALPFPPGPCPFKLPAVGDAPVNMSFEPDSKVRPPQSQSALQPQPQPNRSPSSSREKRWSNYPAATATAIPLASVPVAGSACDADPERPLDPELNSEPAGVTAATSSSALAAAAAAVASPSSSRPQRLLPPAADESPHARAAMIVYDYRGHGAYVLDGDAEDSDNEVAAEVKSKGDQEVVDPSAAPVLALLKRLRADAPPATLDHVVRVSLGTDTMTTSFACYVVDSPVAVERVTNSNSDDSDSNDTRQHACAPLLICFQCKMIFTKKTAFSRHVASVHDVKLLSEQQQQQQHQQHSSMMLRITSDCLQFEVSSLRLICFSHDFTELKRMFETDTGKQWLDDEEHDRPLSAKITTSLTAPTSNPNSNHLNLNSQTPHSNSIIATSTVNMPDACPDFSTVTSASSLSGMGIFYSGGVGALRKIDTDCPRPAGYRPFLPQETTMTHSRNYSKTLKCPKCNWHYKYQETLEIHMKEKHPDSDVSCSFCLHNQPHPKLARGENYSCGYKPYRCNVCKYSTTTKGNLSIHMQSDKHLSNVHELQQAMVADGTGTQAFRKPSPVIAAAASVIGTEETGPSSAGNGVPSSGLNRNCKSSFRCDVCNYETNIARNLRIHMTSEKHAQNMLLLQPHLNLLQAGSAAAYANSLVAGALESTSVPNTNATGRAPTAFPHSVLNSLCLEPQLREGDILRTYLLLHDEQLWSSGFLSSKLFQCCICIRFMCETIEQLSSHIYADRSKSSDVDISVVGGKYQCNLCQYKTHLKANFQLHTKTDKHLQRLQLVNHVREGGESNEWRLSFLNQNNLIQLRCVACNELCTNLHKLQSHVASLRHGCSVRAWRTVDSMMTETGQDDQGAPVLLLCTLCRFYAASKSHMFAHLHSAAHVGAASRYVAMMEELAPACRTQPLPDWVQVQRALTDAPEDNDGEDEEDDQLEAEPEEVDTSDAAAPMPTSADSHGKL